MIDSNFYIKVIDFGDAKIYEDNQSSKKSSKQNRTSNTDRRASNVSISDASSFFGRLQLGKTQKLKRKETFVGTPMYCAPEMLEENNQAGLFTDLWALGCIIYEMSCGI
jgi:serine/threonine protein kinase